MFPAPPSFARALGAVLVVACLPHCALGFDATVPSFDAGPGEDAAGQQDASGADGDSDLDARAEVGPQDADDASPDVGPQDADDRSADVPFDSDAADSLADGDGPPSVRVTAPLAGDYVLGEVMQVAWTASGAESATLSLVEAEGCELGVVGVVVEVIAELEASVGTYAWTVPTTLAPDAYQIRVSVDGADATFGCSEVFTVVQPPACESSECVSTNRVCVPSGAGTTCGQCLAGYTESSGDCVPVDCGGTPPPPSNATLASVTTTRFGGVATFTCVEGHTTSGAAGGGVTVTRRCGESATWESAGDDCRPVDCGATPTPSANARLLAVDRTTFGGVATYSCESGYLVADTRRGEFTITCGVSGSWTAGAICAPVDCGTLSNPLNGTVLTPDGSGPGAIANYACIAGYSLTGSATRTCELSGDWSGTAPTCAETNECTVGSVCTATGNSCTNTAGSWQCSCAAGYTGTSVTGGNASCTVEPPLGASCTTDTQCPSNSWCSTVSGFRRCSPRVFSGAAHQMDFVFVPAGTFQQGSGTNEERPYTATIGRNYFVGRTEVTQGQWKAATGGTNPSCFQSTTGTSCTTSNANNSGPVEQVDWYSTVAYANWLSTNQGLSACYTLTGCSDPTSGWHDGAHSGCTGATFTGLTCTGYRLLTESEWERAARGGTTSTYYWGEATDTATVGLYAWFSGNSGNRTQAVGGKQANAYGLFDMSGNVWESVWDWVYIGSAWINYPSGSATDYVGPASGRYRGIRGGDWRNALSNLRSASRFYSGPDARFYILGFRLARTAD